MDTPLTRMLNPEAVAVLGASRNPAKRGHQAVVQLIEERFAGAIYPINPNSVDVAGIPCLPSLLDVPAHLDLVLIALPADQVVEAIEDCGRVGANGAVVLAAGFGETGEEGRRLETELSDAAMRSNVRIIGPNTSGLFNLNRGLNLLGVRGVRRGPLGVLSQSGNVALGLFEEAALRSKLGFSTYVGVGNESDLRFADYLAYFREDPGTGVVLVYAEGFRDGRAFLAEARRTVPDKPVVIHKGGRSEVGRQAAISHTGALAGDPSVTDAVLRQAGMISIHRSDQLFAAAETLALQPPLRSNRVAVIADGGGHATMAADALTEYGVVFPELGTGTQRQLRTMLPPAASVRNPVDVAGGTDLDPGVFVPVVETILDDTGIDGVLLVGLFGGYATRFAGLSADEELETAEQVSLLASEKGKPVVVQSVYAGHQPPTYDVLGRGGVPIYESIDVAARCISVLERRGRFLANLGTRSSFLFPGKQVRRAPAGHGMLAEHKARDLLSAYGAPVGPWKLAESPADAVAAASDWPAVALALKIVSPDIVHKSDVGGVMLDVRPEHAGTAFETIVRRAQGTLPDASIEGVLVSPMEARGIEMIVGMVRDPSFGPIVMVGLGGVLVEVIRDTAFRAAPVSPAEAEEMLNELTAAELLGGVRGAFSFDRAGLTDLILTMSEIAGNEPTIEEIDLNPVVVSETGVAIVDARVVLA